MTRGVVWGGRAKRLEGFGRVGKGTADGQGQPRVLGVAVWGWAWEAVWQCACWGLLLGGARGDGPGVAGPWVVKLAWLGVFLGREKALGVAVCGWAWAKHLW